MASLPADLRFAVRTLRRSWGFSVVVILILGIGIGANTAIFASVRALFLRPLPFRDGDRVVRLWESKADGFRGSVSEENFLDWQADTRTIEDMVALEVEQLNLAVDSPEKVKGQVVTEGFFRLVGGSPQLGRTFVPEEFRPGSNQSVILSHGLWQRVLGGDPTILNRSLDLSGKTYAVVGVMPAGFLFPGSDAAVWLPRTLERKRGRGTHYLDVYGRLRPGVTLQEARLDLEAIARRLAGAHPSTNADRFALILPIREALTTRFRATALVLGLAVVFTLLIGCANVANLMLARATARTGEMAVRLTLGATRGHLLRQLMTEALVLALTGVAFGALVAGAAVRWLDVMLAPGVRGPFEVRFDLPVLAFTMGLSVLCVLLFGLGPALQLSRPGLVRDLKEGAARSTAVGSRAMRILVVVEIALSMILVVGAGMLTRSLSHLGKVSMGFDPQHLLTFRVALTQAKYSGRDAQTMFYERLVDRLMSLPGVASAAAIDDLPLAATNFNGDFEIVGRPPWQRGREPLAEFLMASHSYFRTLGSPITRGRAFDGRDRTGAPMVTIINETFARRHFAGQDPINQSLKILGETRTIVGVVTDVRRRGQQRRPIPETYVPLAQPGDRPVRVMSLLLRASGDPLALAGAVRRQVQALDAEQAIFELRTMEEILDESVSLVRQRTLVLTIFAGIALILAALGIYGVRAYDVNQRTQELGIRMAIGARAGQLQKMLLHEGMMLCGLGVALGALVSIGVARVLRRLVFGVNVMDGFSYFFAAAMLIGVGLLASWLPSRRVTRLGPMTALRTR